MKGAAAFGAIAVIIVILAVALASVFTVDQTEQALVLRFGEPVPGAVSSPRLGFISNTRSSRMSFFSTIASWLSRRRNRRCLRPTTTGSTSISFLRYRIVDPLKFYQTVGSPERANSQLGFILNSAVRRVLGEANMTDIVRENRADLMVKIREQVNQEGGRLGIAAVDVRIRRADLPRQISEKVFSRMQSERAREAAEYRAKGSEIAQTTGPRPTASRGAARQRAATSRPDARRRRRGTKPHFRRGLGRTLIFSPSTARCKPMRPG